MMQPGCKKLANTASSRRCMYTRYVRSGVAARLPLARRYTCAYISEEGTCAVESVQRGGEGTHVQQDLLHLYMTVDSTSCTHCDPHHFCLHVQVDIPIEFSGHSYGDLFKYLVEEELVRSNQIKCVNAPCGVSSIVTKAVRAILLRTNHPPTPHPAMLIYTVYTNDEQQPTP